MMPSLKVSKIENGTVIDHIDAGNALAILEILDVSPEDSRTTSVVLNVDSSKHGKKDVIKIEDKQLEEWEIESAALFAPRATLNIVEDYEVVEKKTIQLPDTIQGLVDCPNTDCVSNTGEPVKSRFKVFKNGKVELKCHYCEELFSYDELDIS